MSFLHIVSNGLQKLSKRVYNAACHSPRPTRHKKQSQLLCSDQFAQLQHWHHSAFQTRFSCAKSLSDPDACDSSS